MRLGSLWQAVMETAQIIALRSPRRGAVLLLSSTSSNSGDQ